MFVRRLETLAGHLDAVAINPPPDRRFSLSTWLSNDCSWSSGCGTQACAIGEASFVPEFKKLGFHMRFSSVNHGTKWPWYKRKNNWAAVRAFFGITQEVADTLFNMNSYPSGARENAALVAQRIRNATAEFRAERDRIRS